MCFVKSLCLCGLPSDNLSLLVGWSFLCEMLIGCETRDRDSSGNPFAWEMRQSMTNRDKQKIVADSLVTK